MPTSSPVPNPGISREHFFRDYGEAIASGHAGLFVGAGLSRASGFVDWKGLLSDFAIELGLDLEIETDLTAVAQYHLNREGRNRGRLNQKLVDEFTGGTLTDTHKVLASLPIRTYWTTNYDGSSDLRV